MVKDKVVLITGAAQRIGYEIGKLFAEAGAKVVLTDLHEENVVEAGEGLNRLGLTARGLKCDVTSEEELKSVIDATVSEFGRLDVLINNAGLQYVSMLEDFPTEKFELLTRVMLVAPFVATKLAFPVMKAQGFGRILNMASINGLVGFAGKAAYNRDRKSVV